MAPLFIIAFAVLVGLLVGGAHGALIGAIVALGFILACTMYVAVIR